MVCDACLPKPKFPQECTQKSKYQFDQRRECTWGLRPDLRAWNVGLWLRFGA